MSKEIEFSELMSSRFCHDLAGSIGAINNSIDFLDSKNEEMRNKAIDLVHFSSNQAINRVTFFRKAYGFASKDIEVNLGDIRILITAFLDGAKLKINFDKSWDPTSVNGVLGKLILNAALIVASSIMHRGTIQLNIEGKKKVKIIADSESYKVSEELLEILKGRGKSLEKNTRNIQHFYTYAVAKSINYDIDIENTSKGVLFTLSPL